MTLTCVNHIYLLAPVHEHFDEMPEYTGISCVTGSVESLQELQKKLGAGTENGYATDSSNQNFRYRKIYAESCCDRD